MRPESHAEPLLQVTGLSRHFKTRSGTVRAVDGVSFEVRAGRCLGIIGESGCGKTTTARMLLRLESPTSGEIRFKGRRIDDARGADLRDYRRHVQAVFQDPYGALSPRMRVADIIAEPMLVEGLGRGQAEARAADLMQRVGLDPTLSRRYPHEFSGGQRQRIAIARGLSLSPLLLVLDEPVSALDVSIRAQVVNLLMDLQDELGLGYVLISHDLDLMFHICHDVVVMYMGEVVESGPVHEVASNPRHPYTRMLLDARLPPRPRALSRASAAAATSAGDDLPSPLDMPTGCRFRTRCPKAMSQCATTAPTSTAVSATHSASCHLIADPTGATGVEQ